MSLLSDAVALDKEAVSLADSVQSTFIRIGRVMSLMTDDKQLWRLLTDARTGGPYRSQESWVAVRFRSQRATAFSARGIYRTLAGKVPDAILEAAEPGSLKIMAELPTSAQKNPKIHELIASSTVSAF